MATVKQADQAQRNLMRSFMSTVENGAWLLKPAGKAKRQERLRLAYWRLQRRIDRATLGPGAAS